MAQVHLAQAQSSYREAFDSTVLELYMYLAHLITMFKPTQSN